MKKSGLLAVAVLLSLSSGVFAADFDQDLNEIFNTVDTMKAPPPGGFQPGGHGGFQPGHGGGDHNNPPPVNHPQPVGPGHDNHPGPQPGGPGHDNHPGPGHDGWNNNHPGPGHDNHPGPQPWNPGPGHNGGNDWNHNGGNDWNHNGGNDWDHHGNDWDHHHPVEPMHPMYECTDWTFKADTPNPFNDKIYFYDGQNRIQSQKVSINIGPRDLKPWETETISVCPGGLNFDKSLFNYAVVQKDNSGFGSFFTGEKSYAYTLTPTGRKAATPDSQGIGMLFGGATPNGTVDITLSDKWAQYYQGQQVLFNVKVMRMPDNLTGLSPQELLEALKEKTFSVAYPVSGQYQIQLFDSVLPGTYMVTVAYVRDGASLSQIFSFKI